MKMNKSLMLSISLLFAGACNINAEKSIEQALLDSDFNAISKNAELQLGISQSKKKHYLKIAQNMVKNREADTKSWVPHKWSAFLNVLGSYLVLNGAMAKLVSTVQVTTENPDANNIIEAFRQGNSFSGTLQWTISAICFHRAYNYKQGFYRNAVAIKAIIENAPVIESVK